MGINGPVLISPNAFKGTLSPVEAARQIEKEFKKISPATPLILKPLADGGDGTLELLVQSFRGKIQKTKVKNSQFKTITASWGLLSQFNGEKTAVIEMARACGLALVKGKNNIMTASSYGTGQLIKAALDKGCTKILLGVGGTASADGGAGALVCLGLKIFDKSGGALSARIDDLLKAHHVDRACLDPRLKKTKIIILCDVKNPLLGKNGSARIFGPQKGASPRQVVSIEKALGLWAKLAKFDVKNKPGAGAAGALAFGMAGFLGAKLVNGAQFVMDASGWEKAVEKAGVIITGEGRVDKTSFDGKVIGALVKKRRGRKVWVLCGQSKVSRQFLSKKGISHVVQMGPGGLRFPKAAIRAAVRRLITVLP